MISVALCTYNGEVFIKAQVMSILEQSIPPDEIVVGDDGSTDNTIRLIESLVPLAKSRGVEIKFLDSSEHFGVAKNFERTIKKTSGDVIFLSDQDDVWGSTKVQEVMEFFEINPTTLLVHTDAVIVDSSLKPSGKTLFSALKFNAEDRKLAHSGSSFSLLLQRNLVTGATTAIRRQLLNVGLPIGDGWLHDEWLAVCASAHGGYGLIDKCLIYYRQHSSNVIGVRKRTLRSIAAHYIAPRGVAAEFVVSRDHSILEFAKKNSWNESQVNALGTRMKFDRSRSGLSRHRIKRIPTLSNLWFSGLYREFSHQPFSDCIRDFIQRH